jgi:hypothetical protein
MSKSINRAASLFATGLSGPTSTVSTWPPAAIQEAEHHGRQRRRRGPPLIVAALVAVVSMALAGPALAAELAPTVTKIEPSNGPAAGGTPVTITGAHFTGAKGVKFGSTNVEFLVISDTQVNTRSPEGTGTVDVTVTTPHGTSATSSADLFTYAEPLPFVQRVTPLNGPAAGGTSVTITGGRFTGATAVKFGSNNATSFKVESETTITAVSPAYTGGSASVYVSVTTPAGTSEPQHSSILPESFFRYGPTVTRVVPESGPPAGGTSVGISGTGFSSVKGPDELPFVRGVRFGSTPAASFAVSENPFGEAEIMAVSPPGTATVDVTVETYGGTSPTTSADLFSYGPPPTVIKVEPTNLALTRVSSTELKTTWGVTTTIYLTGFYVWAFPSSVEWGGYPTWGLPPATRENTFKNLVPGTTYKVYVGTEITSHEGYSPGSAGGVESTLGAGATYYVSPSGSDLTRGRSHSLGRP